MIRHDRVVDDLTLPAYDPDRFHLSALSEHDVAREVGRCAFATWRGKRAADRQAFKERVRSLTTPDDRLDAYDPEQVTAYVAPDTDMPHLITQDADLPDAAKHPDDLLTDHEAAAYLGMTVRSLRQNVHKGLITDWVMIAGIRWWPRHTLTCGTTGRVGRPPAVEGAIEEIKEWIAATHRGERDPVTTREIKATYGVSLATADRYHARARQDYNADTIPRTRYYARPRRDENDDQQIDDRA